MAVTCLKSSEYRGDQNTAVARRSVFLKQQEIQSKKAAQAAAAPAAHKKGKGSNKSAKGLPESRAVRKLEAHPAATPSLSEVLYVEAWGERETSSHRIARLVIGVHPRSSPCSSTSTILNVSPALPFQFEGSSGPTSHCAEAR